jgi:hypothetical protein
MLAGWLTFPLSPRAIFDFLATSRHSSGEWPISTESGPKANETLRVGDWVLKGRGGSGTEIVLE